MDDVIRTGVNLVRRRETARAEFIASVEAAQRDGDEKGYYSIDDVAAELDGIIAEEGRARA